MTRSSGTFPYRATEIYLIAMVTLFQLFTGPGGYILLGWKKFLLFSALTAAWAIAVFAGEVFCRGHRIRICGSDILTLAFALAAVLSTLLSPWSGSFFSYETGRYDGLATYLLYCIILLGAARYGRPGRTLLCAFSAAYGLNCVIVLMQLEGKNPLALYPEALNYLDPYVRETAPFLGTVGNIDLMSALHCLALPVMGITLLIGRKRSRFLLLIPLAMGTVCVIAAGVSSGILALAVEAVVLLGSLPKLLHDRYGLFPGKGRGFLLLMGWGPVAAICIVALAVIRFGAMPPGTLSEFQSLLGGELRGEFGSHRIEIWEACLKLFRRRPLFGTGPDTLGNLLPVRFTRISPLTGAEVSSVADNAHNEYLQCLTCFGIFGLLPVLLLQLNTAIAFFRYRTDRAAEVTVLAGACLCYMIQAFFNIGLCITTPLACIAWGLLIGALNRENGEIMQAGRPVRRGFMQVRFYGQTNIGAYRENNEDNFCLNGVFREDVSCPMLEYSGTVCADSAFFAVFDGMGGADSGEEASLLACVCAKEYLTGNTPDALSSFYSAANERVCGLAASRGLADCGTTTAVLEIKGRAFRWSNIGDSRVYLLRGSVLRCLSTDDSEYRRLKDLGFDAPAKTKNYLTQFVGVPPKEFEIEPHISEFSPLMAGDRFLLCSDGLTGTVDDEIICRILSENADPAAAGKELILSALDNGETDNITAVIADVGRRRFALQNIIPGVRRGKRG